MACMAPVAADHRHLVHAGRGRAERADGARLRVSWRGGFEITDELYLKTAGFEENPDILPLFRSDYDFSPENFNPPPLAPEEQQKNWSHPKGSNLITWAKRTGQAPLPWTLPPRECSGN